METSPKISEQCVCCTFSKLESLVAETYRSFSIERMDELFNVLLVLYGVRPATLFESANYKTDPQEYELWGKVVQTLIEDHTDEYGLVERPSNRPQHLFYNKACVTEKQVADAMVDNKAMGEVLGYECPGQFGGGCVVSYGMTLHRSDNSSTTIPFYTEVCLEKPKEPRLQDKLSAFQEIGKCIDVEVVLTVRYVLTPDAFLKQMTTFPLDVEALYLHRKNVANIYWNGHYIKTGNLIYDAENVDALRNLADTYGKLWAILAIHTIHDPLAPFYPLGVEEGKQVDAILTKNEEDYYHLF